MALSRPRIFVWLVSRDKGENLSFPFSRNADHCGTCGNIAYHDRSGTDGCPGTDSQVLQHLCASSDQDTIFQDHPARDVGSRIHDARFSNLCIVANR